MLQLPFNALKNNYSSKQTVKQAELFKEIGWDDLLGKTAFENTCAIRFSLAMIKSGITIPNARTAIKSGLHAGKRIEPGQGKLSLILASTSMLGAPEKFRNGEYEKGIASRSGIVSFFHLIPGIYEQGHIDIVSAPDGGAKRCGSECYWTSKEVWFWALK